MFTLVPDISPTKPVELHHMTRKQATIAVRSGLNDDEQYGCVVPPIHLSSTYNFTGFNEPRAHDYCGAATQRAMWFSERWQNWKAVLVQYLLIPACPRFTGNDRLFETAICWLRRTTATAVAIACSTARRNAVAIACCLLIKAMNRHYGQRWQKTPNWYW